MIEAPLSLARLPLDRAFEISHDVASVELGCRLVVIRLTERILLLVDYNNMCPRPESSLSDAEINMETILGKTLDALRPYLSARSIFDVRLYGGWTDEDGLYTRSALFLLSVLYRYRRRMNGHLILPALVETGFCMPGSRLTGFMRCRVKRTRQKMVDTLLTVDLVCPKIDPETCIVVLSGDDDFVPGLLSSRSVNNCPVILIRQKAAYSRPNDHVLRCYQISIIEV